MGGIYPAALGGTAGLYDDLNTIENTQPPNGETAQSASRQQPSQLPPVPAHPLVYAQVSPSLAPPGASNSTRTVPAGPGAAVATNGASAQTRNATAMGYGHYNAAQQAAYDETKAAVYQDEYHSRGEEPPPENNSPAMPSDLQEMFDSNEQLTKPTDEFKASRDQEIVSQAHTAAKITADQVGLREQLQSQIASTKDPAKLAKLQQAYKDLTYAFISKDAYNDTSIKSSLPPGVSRLDPNDPNDQQMLAKLGLQPSDLRDDAAGYFAAVYHDADSNQYIIANRGSESATNDWKNNFAQGLGMYAQQYDDAVKVADKIAEAKNNGSFSGSVAFTGHSLGGGLAATQAMRAQLPATTFDAAGVSQGTIDSYKLNTENAKQTIRAVSNGDILTVSQDALRNEKPAVNDAWDPRPQPHPILVGEAVLRTPVYLPTTKPDGSIAHGQPMNAFQHTWNIKELHGMDYNISSIFHDAQQVK